MNGSDIPLPPPALRALVGPTDPADYDNPTRQPLLHPFGVPEDAYRAVFDFGCGCGRHARQLMLQTAKPDRYVGIDVHKGMVDWCRANLTPVNPAFQFVHHDVYSPWYAPGNSLNLAQRFPVEDASFTLVIGHSVFTHVMQNQAEYYLSEVARILAPGGIAFTSWLFFDRASFRFLEHVYALYTSPIDFGQAVVFDREWFLATVRRLGLGITATLTPPVAGHQWNVLLSRREPSMIDRFPLGADGAEWVCGATAKPIGVPANLPAYLEGKLPPLPEVYVPAEDPTIPEPVGYLAELAAARASGPRAAWNLLARSARTVRGLLHLDR